MIIQVKTLAQVREITGESDLTLSVDDNELTVGALKQMLQSRSAQWKEVMHKGILTACNQVLCDDDFIVNDSDEVAFFPPVTGG